MNWSGGKDAMLVLHKVNHLYPDGDLLLLTRFDESKKAISMHYVEEALLDMQAKSLGRKLKKVFLPALPDNLTYSQKMEKVWLSLKAEGFEEALFGDIFLEEIKSWNEKQLAPLGITCSFPLWKTDTHTLADYFIEKGFKAVIVAADGDFFGEETVGRMYDRQFIESLPGHIDPCGENGEFHTFVVDGPGFLKPLGYRVGKPKQISFPSPVKDGAVKRFWYTRLISSQ